MIKSLEKGIEVLRMFQTQMRTSEFSHVHTVDSSKSPLYIAKEISNQLEMRLPFNDIVELKDVCHYEIIVSEASYLAIYSYGKETFILKDSGMDELYPKPQLYFNLDKFLDEVDMYCDQLPQINKSQTITLDSKSTIDINQIISAYDDIHITRDGDRTIIKVTHNRGRDVV